VRCRYVYPHNEAIHYFHSECEYAVKLKKKMVFVRTEEYTADKWLGLVVGQAIYYDCFDMYAVDECAKKVAVELGGDGKKPRRVTKAVGAEDDCCTVS